MNRPSVWPSSTTNTSALGRRICATSVVAWPTCFADRAAPTSGMPMDARPSSSPTTWIRRPSPRFDPSLSPGSPSAGVRQPGTRRSSLVASGSRWSSVSVRRPAALTDAADGLVDGRDAPDGRLIVEPDADDLRRSWTAHRDTASAGHPAAPASRGTPTSRSPPTSDPSSRRKQQSAVGADGIGLVRTELLFLGRTTPPSMAEQRATYARIREVVGDRPMVFRTLDVGGDKPAAWQAERPRPTRRSVSAASGWVSRGRSSSTTSSAPWSRRRPGASCGSCCRWSPPSSEVGRGPRRLDRIVATVERQRRSGRCSSGS